LIGAYAIENCLLPHIVAIKGTIVECYCQNVECSS